MQVEIKLDPTARETKVIIVTDKMDTEVQALVNRITQEQPQILAGFRGDSVALLDRKSVV